MNEVVFVLGCPASGKSTQSQTLIDQGYIHLNRDKEGKTIADLLPKLESLLAGKQNVVLDNTFPTIESRKPFIQAAQKAKTPVRCVWMSTSIEDAQINALHRMWERYKKIFFTQEDLKEVPKDPNMFPPAVLFKYRKEFEKPTTGEGFSKVEKITFKRKPLSSDYKNAAIIFDYDQTLRDCKNDKGYPTKPEDIFILKGRKEFLQKLKKQGTLLLGVSNQSGVAKKVLTYDDAVACFEHTNKLLDAEIAFHFCPHNIPPMNCYCRKPQSGIGVYLIEKYKLNPSEVLFVGDQTTDKTFAERLGFKYVDQKDYFE